MSARTVASEFLYTKPQTTNSEKAWFNYQGQKTEILTLRLFHQHVLKRLFLALQRKVRWKSSGNLMTRISESCDTHKASLVSIM